MSKKIKYIIAVAVLVIVAFGLYTHFSHIETAASAPSPSGSTFSTSKANYAEVTLISTTTIASLPLPSQDLVASRLYCYIVNATGNGTDNGLINIKAATSTSPSGLVNSAGNANANYLANSSISTTTNANAINLNWFSNPLNSTTTAIVGNVAGSALASSTIYIAGGGTTYVDFIADEPLIPPTYGICGYDGLSL